MTRRLSFISQDALAAAVERLDGSRYPAAVACRDNSGVGLAVDQAARNNAA